jgi:hypothetical protein
LQKTNAALDALEHLTASANTPGDWLLRAFVLEFAERIDEADIAYTHAVALERGPAERSGVRNRLSDARVAFLRRHGRNEVANHERLEARGIPARDPGTDQRLLDLGPHYSGSLKKPFDTGIPGDDLAEVPSGVHTLAGVPFDIRGVIDRPAADILVQRPVRRLHFLQGATSLWLGPTNERPVAVFVVHYADGERKEIPVIGGRHVRDWFILPQEPVTAGEAEVAWVGLNARSRNQDMRLRLFKRTWENPRPDASIVRIDFDKRPYQGLFVLAITADDGHLPASQPEDPLILAEIADATGQAERGLPAVEAALRGNPGSPHILE